VVRNLTAFTAACYRFDLDYNQTVVLDAKQVEATAADILATHCIPDAMSEDLRQMTDDAC
jgi:hypothetical protein